MKLVQNSKAVFRFRKLVAMPFAFAAQALSQTFPFVLAGSLLFVLPGLWSGASLSKPGTSDLFGFIYTLILGGVFACQAAVFSITLTVAARALLPDATAGVRAPLSGMKALSEKVWPHFAGMLAGIVSFGFLFAVLTAMPFQSALTELTVTGNPVRALWTFAGHIVLEAINPWFWLFGFVAGIYFRSAAKRAVKTFESLLDALDLRVKGAPSLTSMVDANRKLFALLVSVPHFLSGLAFALFSVVAHGYGVSGLIKSTADFSNGPLLPLAASFGFNLLLAALFSLVAGFVAIIWLAAAQSAGIVDMSIAAEAGFGAAPAKPAARAKSNPLAAARPLAGSGPVVRRPRLGL
jgi:hypothetical protein